MRRPLLLLVATGHFLLAACASRDEVEKIGTRSDGIQGGTNDTSHSYAVGVCPSNSKQECIGVCSGALIAPNLVVTARHCVDQVANEGPNGSIDCSKTTFSSNQLASNFFVTTEPNMFTATKWHQVKSISRAGGGGGGTLLCGNDLVLLFLADNVSASEATPVTPAVQHAITERPPYSLSITAIGYGVTSPAEADKSTSGIRRIRQKIAIQCIPGDKTVDCPNEVYDAMDKKEFLAKDGTCSGDSGSSAYEQTSFTKNAPVTFGVLSRGGTDGTTCSTPIYSRIDSWSAFVINGARQAATQGGYSEPSWTSAIPRVDAGTPDAGSTAQKGLGEECESNDECASQACLDGDESDGVGPVCVATCDPAAEESTCAEGLACREMNGENFCLTPVITVAEEPRALEDSAGCSMGRGARDSSGVWFPLAGAFGALLLGARRRRSR